MVYVITNIINIKLNNNTNNFGNGSNGISPIDLALAHLKNTEKEKDREEKQVIKMIAAGATNVKFEFGQIVFTEPDPQNLQNKQQQA